MKPYQKNIVLLRAGIGNQLFQYAFSKYAKLVTKKDTFIYYYASYDVFHRKSILKSIKLPKELTQNLLLYIVCVIYEHSTKVTVIINYILNLVGFNISTVHQQRTPDVDVTLYHKYPCTTDRQGIVIFEGYWPSAKMVNLFKDELVKELVNFKIKDDKYTSIEKEIERHEETVAIHIRSDWNLDYSGSSIIPHSPGVSIHVQQVLTKNYYERAIREVMSKSEGSFFRVFADDNSNALKLVEGILHKDKFMLVPNYRNVDSDYSVLMLMSKCKNFIMSNSTFSWWGAWLSWARNEPRNQDASYFMPNQWTTRDNEHERSKKMMFSPQCILLED